jgi:hypothetical protein
MFQVLNKVTGGKPRATRRSSGGRRVILKALDIDNTLTISIHKVMVKAIVFLTSTYLKNFKIALVYVLLS